MGNRFGIAVLRKTCPAIAGCALLFLCLSAGAQPRSIWWIEPAEATINVGESISLALWLDVGDNIPSASSYRAVQAELGWDPVLLNASTVEHHLSFWLGGLCSNPSFINRSGSFFDGRAVVSQFSTIGGTSCPTTRTPFKLYTIPFVALHAGTAWVDFLEATRLVYQFTPTTTMDEDFDVVGAVIHVIDPNQPTDTPVPAATPRCVCAVAGASGDADGDSLSDGVEYNPDLGSPSSGSNRYLWDTDGDGLSDGFEDANGNGARDAGELNPRNRDSDGDRLWDSIEVFYGGDPLNAADPGGVVDADMDGLPSAPWALDPDDALADTDGDGYADGLEAATCGLGSVGNANQIPPLADLNCDVAVSNLDALIVQTIQLGITPHGVLAGESNADSNRDGFASNLDSLIINSWFLGLAPLLPIPTF